jgi:hypothetical protein
MTSSDRACFEASKQLILCCDLCILSLSKGAEDTTIYGSSAMSIYFDTENFYIEYFVNEINFKLFGWVVKFGRGNITAVAKSNFGSF